MTVTHASAPPRADELPDSDSVEIAPVATETDQARDAIRALATKPPAGHHRLARGDRGLLRRGGSRDLWSRLVGTRTRSAGPNGHRAPQYLQRSSVGESIGQGEPPDAAAGRGAAGWRVGYPCAGNQPGRGGGSRFESDRLGSRSRPRHGRARAAQQRRCRRPQCRLWRHLRAAEPAQARRQDPHRYH